MTWAPANYHPIVTPPAPGDRLAYLIEACEGYTSKKGLPKVDLTFEFMNGSHVCFSLVFGIAPWLDLRNSMIMDTLIEAAGLQGEGNHQLIDVTTRLHGRQLGVTLDKDPSPLSRSGLRLKEVFGLIDESEQVDPESKAEGEEGEGCEPGEEGDQSPGLAPAHITHDAPEVIDVPGDPNVEDVHVGGLEAGDLERQNVRIKPNQVDRFYADGDLVNPGFREL